GNPLDIWILSESKRLILEVTQSLDGYDPAGATNAISQFIDKLSNWYIRRSRRRFWKSESDSDKTMAYDTLYTVFLDFLKVLAPFLPFITEEIYQNIVLSVRPDAPKSIHLCDYPTASEDQRNLTVEHRMNLIREAVSLGRSLRNKYQIKVRQPLRELIVVCHDKADESIVTEMTDLIIEELNVKSVSFAGNEEELVTLIIKPNLKLLGPRLGKDLKQVAPLITSLTGDDVKSLEGGKSLSLSYDGKSVEIFLEDLLIERKEREGLLIEVSQTLTVALNSEITPELRREGFAREFVNKVQNMRKDQGFDVQDRISINYHSSDIVKSSVEELEDYIRNETLAVDITFSGDGLKEAGRDWDLNGESSTIAISRA
ncbi:MAG: DUF5915 domain-containing protein, partial [Spirochaetota bacterium]|nr:DUF5915 domain-containing protein [Spirochaetota bacterium]